MLATISFLRTVFVHEQYQIILVCRKTVFKNNDSTWIKTGLDNFDVPMGGYDSAQITDHVGL